MTVKVETLGTGSVHPGFEEDMMNEARGNMIEDICPLCDGGGKVMIPAGKASGLDLSKEEETVREALPKPQADNNDRYVWFRKLVKVFLEKPASADVLLMSKDMVVIDSNYKADDELRPEDCTLIVQRAVKFASIGAVISEGEEDDKTEEDVADD